MRISIWNCNTLNVTKMIKDWSSYPYRSPFIDYSTMRCESIDVNKYKAFTETEPTDGFKVFFEILGVVQEIVILVHKRNMVSVLSISIGSDSYINVNVLDETIRQHLDKIAVNLLLYSGKDFGLKAQPRHYANAILIEGDVQYGWAFNEHEYDTSLWSSFLVNRDMGVHIDLKSTSLYYKFQKSETNRSGVVRSGSERAMKEYRTLAGVTEALKKLMTEFVE